jgi:hypothetical protein
MEQAFQGLDAAFLDLDELRAPGALAEADLLVLPYGSAFPADAWAALRDNVYGVGLA